MKIQRYIPLLLALFCVFASCKKEEESKDLKYLYGVVEFDMPPFVLQGDMVDIYPGGIYRDTETVSSVGYFWKDPVSGKNDTIRREGETYIPHFVYTVPSDTCGTMTLYVYAFAKGYNNSSGYVDFSIVDPRMDGKGSITGLEPILDCPSFPETRGEKMMMFYYNEMNGRNWSVRNEHLLIEYDGEFRYGHPFADAPAMADVFGVYYTESEARDLRACPKGWHVATERDWVELAKAENPDVKPLEDFEGVSGALMADAKFNGAHMWEFYREVKITNKYKFCAIPTGYMVLAGKNATYNGAFQYSAFWSRNTEGGADEMCVRLINVRYPKIYFFVPEHDNSYGASIRCVEDN